MLDLAMVARRLRVRGSALRLRGAQPQIITLIELMGLHRLPGSGSRVPGRRSPSG